MAHVRGYTRYRRSQDRLLAAVRQIAETEPARSAETVRTNVVNDLRTKNAPGLSDVAPTDRELERDTTGATPTGFKGQGGRSNAKHVPSRPGEPPNTDTGRLLTSYNVSRDPIDGSAIVGTNVVYAVALEEGTSRMRARPHLLPRYYEELRAFVKRTRQAVRTATRKANR